MITSDQRSGGTPGSWRVSWEAGIEVHWVSVPYDNRMSYAQRIRAFLDFALRAAGRAAAQPADVVFATSTPLTIALPAIYAAARLRCPMVFEIRDLWPEVPIAIGALRNPVTKWAARLLQRVAYGSSARIVALAPGMADEVARTGYPRHQIAVIPNGCDGVDAPDDGLAAQIREDAWLGRRPLVVFTGTFGLVNGMDYLPRLAAATRSLDPDVRFVAVGDGREFEATVNLARSLGVLDSNLRFTGQQPRSVASAWNRAADITLALFAGPEIVWRDAVQNKFFESLAAGRPVASNFRGFQSIVAEETGAGIILSSTDLGEAARALVSLLRDAPARQKASEAARELARTRFNRDDLAHQLEDVLTSAVLQPRS
jgi:glycosyltransferase involved in cell wall biosynthesis